MADSDPRRGGARTKARKRALDILFEADLRGTDPLQALADHVGRAEPPVRPFTIELVQTVARRRDEIDDRLADALAGGWTLDRMPRVDRVLARIAVAEMLTGEVAPQIAIDEAATLAGECSTDESPAFLNGLLAEVHARLARSTAAAPEGAEGR